MLGWAFGRGAVKNCIKIVIIEFIHDFGSKSAGKKNSGKISKFFFSIFRNFFAIEIILGERRLRTYFMIVGQTVSEISA